MTVPAQPVSPNPTNTPLFDVPVGGDLESIIQRHAGRIVDIEIAALTQAMALEGQAVPPPGPTDRQDAIDDLLRSHGRLLWRTDLG